MQGYATLIELSPQPENWLEEYWYEANTLEGLFDQEINQLDLFPEEIEDCPF